MQAAPPRSARRGRRALALGAGLLLLAAGGYLARPLASLAPHLVTPAFAEDGSGGGGDGGDGGGSGGDGGGSGSGGGDGGGDDGGGGGSNSGKGNSGSGMSTSGSDDGSATTGTPAAGTPVNGGTTAGSDAGRGQGRDFAAGEVVVVGDRAAVLEEAKELGFRLIDDRTLDALGLSVLRLKTPDNVDAIAGLALLRRAMPQLVADVNSLYEPYKAQAAEVVSLPAPDYARHLIGWSGGSGCGAGLRIGMVDSAVDDGIPALAGQKLHQRSFLGEGASPSGTEHGTAIASLLLGRPDPGHLDGAGLLPAADLYAASIFERHGDRVEANAVGIVAALDWMVAEHVPVVNVSLSGDDNALMALAVTRASQRGTVIVAAAGNGGPDAPPAYPAALGDVIAVTAVDQNEAILPEANRGDYIGFAAPGVRIWTPDENGLGAYRTGTSFAAPFAAAAIAAERLAGAPADVDELRRRLAARAIDLGAPGKDPVFGFGLIQTNGTCGASASAQ
jgi:subtilase family protein